MLLEIFFENIQKTDFMTLLYGEKTQKGHLTKN